MLGVLAAATKTRVWAASEPAKSTLVCRSTTSRGRVIPLLRIPNATPPVAGERIAQCGNMIVNGGLSKAMRLCQTRDFRRTRNYTSSAATPGEQEPKQKPL